MYPLDIFFISPHLDNAESSVGGTIAVSLRQNLHVGMFELASACMAALSRQRTQPRNRDWCRAIARTMNFCVVPL